MVTLVLLISIYSTINCSFVVQRNASFSKNRLHLKKGASESTYYNIFILDMKNKYYLIIRDRISKHLIKYELLVHGESRRYTHHIKAMRRLSTS